MLTIISSCPASTVLSLTCTWHFVVPLCFHMHYLILSSDQLRRRKPMKPVYWPCRTYGDNQRSLFFPHIYHSNTFCRAGSFLASVWNLDQAPQISVTCRFYKSPVTFSHNVWSYVCQVQFIITNFRFPTLKQMPVLGKVKMTYLFSFPV